MDSAHGPFHGDVVGAHVTELCADRVRGLAKLSFGWRIMRTLNLGKKWSKVASLRGSILTLACTTLERCVVGA